MSDTPVETSATQPSTDAPPPKKPHRPKRPLSVSPEKRQANLQNLPGGCCIKCNQALGAESKAVQCDLCGAWIHAICEGFSDDTYDEINAVIGSLNNFVYYCESNNCISRIKQLLCSFFTSDRMDSVHPQFTEQQDNLSKQMNDLSQK